ncbi:PTS fructose transporter subunit IIC [Brevundimonas sp. SORGH_AS_0993]|uniref:PTS fructose transporter subunit IIC n=1 Tax=Brevundimonas sp. SORGH_AS_0993 TaxID=3041794 RepID=UPI00278B5446|nr:fructose-specific PTS transporter subunit EIIC [Brevundimonas sp. SORGH_AS_0993]MDQ1155507.1 PTS system fructose-specific IIC component [Brevundimonas sp. SORGH_AS_0993]
MTLAIIVADRDRTTQPLLAAEALRKAAAARGLTPPIEVRVSGAVLGAIDPAVTPDVLLLVGDVAPEGAPQAGRWLRADIDAVLQDAGAVLTRALEQETKASAGADRPTRIVAITSCPTGIAHTFMAAEGLKQGAEKLGHDIRVETQGSVGARDGLTPEEIAAADVVIIAADTQVDVSRFAGKRVLNSPTKPAINDGAALIAKALSEAQLHGATSAAAAAAGGASTATDKPTAAGAGVYKHLMTGVSFMLPFVVAGGLLIALAFAFGGIYAGDQDGTFAHALFQIGAKAAFTLMVPALAGYVAFSIADRPGLAPGMIGGVLASQIGAGFLGGILAGFIAGYAVRYMSRWIRLPRGLEGLKPVLLLPLLGALVTGLAMIYVVGKPTAQALAALTTWLQALQGGGASTLGALLGGMMAVDMGGPVNKAAYAFSTGLLTNGVYGPMAAVMAGGMTPPLGLFLATRLFPARFTAAERESGPATALLGLAFITEGALPFAARDPLRVIPALVAGSATAGAISMAMGAQLRAPHGGIFVALIPNAVSHVFAYGLAIAAGSVVSAFALRGLLRRLA